MSFDRWTDFVKLMPESIGFLRFNAFGNDSLDLLHECKSASISRSLSLNLGDGSLKFPLSSLGERFGEARSDARGLLPAQILGFAH